uniref:Uncharacterized protein n=1 Tax=Vespula pensylvanica TaxID=30213 RepID=A0A834UAI8_VESPE|nr:hypothetical protein H0235_006630 [Vespula pensylvanica]
MPGLLKGEHFPYSQRSSLLTGNPSETWNRKIIRARSLVIFLYRKVEETDGEAIPFVLNLAFGKIAWQASNHTTTATSTTTTVTTTTITIVAATTITNTTSTTTTTTTTKTTTTKANA